MKNEKLIYGIGIIVLIAGVVMKISHLEFGNQVFLIGVILISVIQSLHIKELKNKIKELANKQYETNIGVTKS